LMLAKDGQLLLSRRSNLLQLQPQLPHHLCLHHQQLHRPRLPRLKTVAVVTLASTRRIAVHNGGLAVQAQHIVTISPSGPPMAVATLSSHWSQRQLQPRPPASQPRHHSQPLRRLLPRAWLQQRRHLLPRVQKGGKSAGVEVGQARHVVKQVILVTRRPSSIRSASQIRSDRNRQRSL